MTFHEGFVTSKEAKRLSTDGGDGSGDAELAKPVRPEVSGPLNAYVDLHRHAAVRADLAGQGGVALRAMLAYVIAGADLWRVDVESQRAPKEDIAESVESCTAEAAFDLMPTTGTKLYTFHSDACQAVYAELFADDEKQRIFEAFDAALEATGFVPEADWGERIEDRGSQITFSALGQQAPIDAKEKWDPDFAKRKIIQQDLRGRLPGLSINMGGAKSIDITREGVDKAYGLTRLRDESGIPLDAMMFIGDAIFPGGNDYPAKTLGLDTICVRDPRETLAVIASIVACLK